MDVQIEALGLIETRGTVASIEAADAALKAANVRLVEQRKVGSGLVTIVLRGDVAAVRAAIDAGCRGRGQGGRGRIRPRHPAAARRRGQDGLMSTAPPVKENR